MVNYEIEATAAYRYANHIIQGNGDKLKNLRNRMKSKTRNNNINMIK